MLKVINKPLTTLVYLLFVFSIGFFEETYARDRVTECSNSFGLGSEKCSDHNFLESLFSLKSFANKNFDEIRENVRCLNYSGYHSDTYLAPSNCGQLYGKYVKDVNIHFSESGWFRKKYTFRDIEFKIIGDREIFKKIINSMSDKEGFSFIKVDAKELVSCEKYKIWYDRVFEYARRNWGFDLTKCPTATSVHQCLAEQDNSPGDLSPLGMECSARGFFQDQKGFIEGDLWISFVELEDFDYRNIIINFYPTDLSD